MGASTHSRRALAPRPSLADDAERGKSVAVRRLTYRGKVRRLDHEIAAGFDPGGDRRRRRRAGEITGPRFRRCLAGKLEQLVREADSSPPWQSPVRWSEVREFSILILALAESLSAPIPVSPQGVARTVVLIDDGASALFGSGAAGTLGVALRSALRGLELGPRLCGDNPADPAVTSPSPMPWGI